MTNKKKKKKGDYRPPQNGKGHRISVNGNLNKYEFLITFIHEYAHLLNWNKNSRFVKPHGEEWKTYFSNELILLIDREVFPKSLNPILYNFIKNPASSTNAHEKLQKIFDDYNYRNSDFVSLEEIPINSLFKTQDGKLFQKKEKRRKRFLCTRIDNKKDYAVSANIRVKIL